MFLDPPLPKSAYVIYEWYLSQLLSFVVSLPVNWLGPSDLDATIIQDKFVFGSLIGFLSSLPSGEMNKSVVFGLFDTINLAIADSFEGGQDFILRRIHGQISNEKNLDSGHYIGIYFVFGFSPINTFNLLIEEKISSRYQLASGQGRMSVG